jgi:Site-specific recombinase XerD
MRLTDFSIAALPVPDSGSVQFYDDLIPGFGVRVSNGGTRSYILTYGTRRQRETIGRVGIITLREARLEAKRRLAEYTLGKERPQTTDWNSAVDEYLQEVALIRRERTHKSYEYALKKHFKYGVTKLSAITPHDLKKNLSRLADRPAEQQHAFVALRAFIRWAYRQHYIDRNPMDRMRQPHPYRPRDRVLSDDELKAIWGACEDDAFGRIVKLLILTGQRVGEITSLTAAMVGEDTITIPASLAKNGHKHFIPLGEQAKALLMPKDADKDRKFLVSATLDKRFNNYGKSKDHLDERCGVSAWRLHDLRRTFASGMASIGIALPVTERLLNHVSGSFGGIVGVYQRYDYMPEMKDAIARWETHVQAIVRGDKSDPGAKTKRKAPKAIRHSAVPSGELPP